MCRTEVRLAEHGAYPEPSTEVVMAVAAAKDVDPLELDPLHDIVDTDALDAIVRSGTVTRYRLEFEYCGAWVELSSSGDLVVTPDAER